jgi:hypothetical protein
MPLQITTGLDKPKKLASVPKLYTTWRLSTRNDAESRDFMFGAGIASSRLPTGDVGNLNYATRIGNRGGLCSAARLSLTSGTPKFG